MKQATWIGLCLALLLLSGCASNWRNGGGSGTGPDVPDTQENLEPAVPEEPMEEPAELGTEPPIVADAAMYRGVVATRNSEGDDLLLRLEQVEGTDFGYEALDVALNDATRLSVDREEIGEGDYLEVFYGASPQDGEAVTAITVTKLPDADLCVFNGTLVEMKEGEEEAGSFLLSGEGEKEDTLFHYGGETQFYLDFSSLGEGDRLNIFFSGATTRSIPPQATALEVRPYKGM